MNNIDNVLLPIGSVCTLKGSNKKIMITAFYPSESSKPDEFYDYSGCLYPEGIIDSKKHFLFNSDKIEKVDFVGYSTEEEKKFKEELSKLINVLKNVDDIEKRSAIVEAYLMKSNNINVDQTSIENEQQNTNSEQVVSNAEENKTTSSEELKENSEQNLDNNYNNNAIFSTLNLDE